MIHAREFISACTLRGFSFFTGVPCSFLKPLINFVIESPKLDYIGAASEGEAVGIASGAYLAGAGAVVMCQNSGLGNMVNPLTSLNFPFRIPLLLIITLRGETGLNDEPQHDLMGQVTVDLLETIKIKWEYFPDSSQDVPAVLDLAVETMGQTGLPFALIMKKGSVRKTVLRDRGREYPQDDFILPLGAFSRPHDKRITRIEMIRCIRNQFIDDEALIATTGKIGRELFTLGDTPNQLYIVGSMGCAAGVGFGIQYAKPEQKIVVLDGDGAVLMKMGTLATIGSHKPGGFIHIILDNEAYDSTGGQRTVSRDIDFCGIAAACGYRSCFRADTPNGLTMALETLRTRKGPSFIHVKVAPGSVSDLARPGLKPHQAKKRFMAFLGEHTPNHG